MTRLGSTPSQTVGPFFHMALPWPDGPYVVPEGTPGAVWLRGRVLDGAGEPVTDATADLPLDRLRGAVVDIGRKRFVRLV